MGRTREIVEKSKALFDERGFGIWGIRERGSNELIGFAGYWHFRTPPSLELLFGVAPSHWHRGIATERIERHDDPNVQISKGFRLGGINDRLNVPLCRPKDLETFGGRETWDDETSWSYEVGAKSRILTNRGSFNIAAYDLNIKDLQATATPLHCRRYPMQV